jgi:phosphoribosylglycinamide formyltransferase-1
MDKKLRLAVLVSGGGSNLQAIIDACKDPDYPAQVVVVVSNKPKAYGLERARKAAIPALAISHKGFSSRQAHEEKIVQELEPHNVDLLVLAGYMRVVTPFLIERFYNHEFNLPGVINIHPADTKQYQGAHGYEFAMGLLPDSKRLVETKITVHFVDPGVDTGPIIQQAPVGIKPEDSLEDLKARGLAIEHDLYPRVIELYATKKLSINNGQVVIS